MKLFPSFVLASAFLGPISYGHAFDPESDHQRPQPQEIPGEVPTQVPGQNPQVPEAANADGASYFGTPSTRDHVSDVAPSAPSLQALRAPQPFPRVPIQDQLDYRASAFFDQKTRSLLYSIVRVWTAGAGLCLGILGDRVYTTVKRTPDLIRVQQLLADRSLSDRKKLKQLQVLLRELEGNLSRLEETVRYINHPPLQILEGLLPDQRQRLELRGVPPLVIDLLESLHVAREAPARGAVLGRTELLELRLAQSFELYYRSFWYW